MQITPSLTTGTYWQWRGQSIYYVQAGDRRPQRPPLLLVHGFGASTDHWKKNIAELRDEFDVWAIDLLGFGRSAKPNWDYSGDLWRNQLHEFITEVVGQPVVLAGNSLGGYASLCVAAQHPQSVAGLVLLNSAGPFTDVGVPTQPNPVQKAVMEASRWVLTQPWGSFLLFQYLRNPATIRKTLQKVYLDKSAVTDELVEAIYRPSCDPGAPQVFAAIFKAQQGDRVDALLHQMTCPLLLLWGEGDPWIRARERSAKFHEHYSNLTEHFLQAGHCPHDEVPQQVNALMRNWIMEHVLYQH